MTDAEINALVIGSAKAVFEACSTMVDAHMAAFEQQLVPLLVDMAERTGGPKLNTEHLMTLLKGVDSLLTRSREHTQQLAELERRIG